MQKQKNAAGASMLEMLMYLGLVMVISVGAMRMYGESVEKTRRIDLSGRLEDIKKAVRLAYIGRDWDLGKTEDARAIYLEGKGVKLSTPWGGKIRVGVANASGIYKRPIFVVKVYDLSQASCMWLASSTTDAACVVANGTSYAAAANCITDPAKASSACNKEGEANEVDMVYYKE
ncbi:MAG: hypothetical protein LBO78_03380 [Rickettsiales bacterium]|jgi:hypothetical protein|nr:hypothetical protein [Rickettsiales bacterium]